MLRVTSIGVILVLPYDQPIATSSSPSTTTTTESTIQASNSTYYSNFLRYYSYYDNLLPTYYYNRIQTRELIKIAMSYNYDCIVIKGIISNIYDNEEPTKQYKEQAAQSGQYKYLSSIIYKEMPPIYIQEILKEHGYLIIKLKKLPKVETPNAFEPH